MPLLKMYDIHRSASHIMSHHKNNIPTNNPPDLAEMEDEDLLISKPEGEIDATQSMAEGKMTAHENYEFSNITFTVRALALPTTTAPNLAIPLFSTDQWESRIMASNH